MNFSIAAAQAANTQTIAQIFSSSRFLIVLLLILSSFSPKAGAAPTSPQSPFPSNPSNSCQQASLLLPAPLHAESQISYQLQSLTFKNCSATAALQAGNQVLSFSLYNPSGNPLPPSTQIASIQIHVPGTEMPVLYQVRTDSGGVIVILSDF